MIRHQCSHFDVTLSSDPTPRGFRDKHSSEQLGIA